jgi:hypothetical protein
MKRLIRLFIYVWRYRRTAWECFECKAWNLHGVKCCACGETPWKWLASTVTLTAEEIAQEAGFP